MSRSRMPLILGLGAAGGVGYYLYSAGGNTKAAENKFESMSLSPRSLPRSGTRAHTHTRQKASTDHATFY